MKVLGLITVMILASACSNTAPVASTYKQKLADPGTGAPVTPAPAPGGSGNATPAAGDATKGEATLVSTCDGCHNDGIAHKLNNFDGEAVQTAAALSLHSGVKAAMEANLANITAALKARP